MAAECLSKTVQDPESKETAAELLESADEMKSMISRWLDVAKLQTGSYEIHPEFCLIKPMIRKAPNIFPALKILSVLWKFHLMLLRRTSINRPLCRSFRIFFPMLINIEKRAVSAE